MNVLIRRLGIVIKSIPINGDRARVGSGEECEVCLSDPYLAPVVAEIIRRDGEWYIVDSGSSLEGIRRGDDRVVDEVLEPGEAYLVGGFEIVREGSSVPRRTQAGAPVAAGIPDTVFQAKLDPLPGTVVQSLEEVRASRPVAKDDSRARLAFRKLATMGGAQAIPESRGGSRRPRLILLAVAVVVAALVLMVVIIGSEAPESGGPAAGTEVAKSETLAENQPAAVAPAPPSQPQGDQAAMALELENAFTGWEAELAAKDDPALRKKIVTAALEIGRVYAAIGDPRGPGYLERVIRYGDPQSTEVAIARERLQLIRN